MFAENLLKKSKKKLARLVLKSFTGGGGGIKTSDMAGDGIGDRRHTLYLFTGGYTGHQYRHYIWGAEAVGRRHWRVPLFWNTLGGIAIGGPVRAVNTLSICFRWIFWWTTLVLFLWNRSYRKTTLTWFFKPIISPTFFCRISWRYLYFVWLNSRSGWCIFSRVWSSSGSRL